jgi:hypothetical protein
MNLSARTAFFSFSSTGWNGQVMTRNGIYGVLGVFALVIVLLAAYVVYQQQTRPQLEVRVDSTGIQVNGNG